MRLPDSALNAFVILLCLLFVTGGVVPPAGAPRFLTEMNQLGPWVAVLISLVVWRRLTDGTGTFTGTRITRHLGALAQRVCQRSGPLYVFIAIWTCLLVAVSIRRHLAFADNGDLAIFDQAFWNTIHGAFVRSTLVLGASGELPIFADHFDPLQLALLPLYGVFPSPLVLLAAQAIALALGALPLYWLARRQFADQPVLSTIFPVAYLLYLPLRSANRYDYHPSTLAPPLLLLALYFMDRSRWAWMAVFLALAGSLKENLPIAGVVVGIYLLLVKRQWLLGLALAAVFGLWFYAGFAWIIPAFNPHGYAHFEEYPALSYTPFGMLLAPLWQPLAFLGALFAGPGRKLSYLVYVLAPVAFLPLLAPTRCLLGLPFLLQNLLSTAPHYTSLQTHHAAELIPFVFYAAVGGASNPLTWLDHARWPSRWDATRRGRALAGLVLACSLLFHDLPETHYLRRYARTPHHERLDTAIGMIPAKASVSAWTKILPHVSQRRALYRFPALGFADAPDDGPDVEFVIVDETLLPRTDVRWVAAYLAALPAKGYERLLEQDGISLLRRRPAHAHASRP